MRNEGARAGPGASGNMNGAPSGPMPELCDESDARTVPSRYNPTTRRWETNNKEIQPLLRHVR
jgi:hypothetical protein